MQALGRQICAEFYDCEVPLDEPKSMERAILKAARDCGATVVSHTIHHFNPYGVSGVVVIAESHIAIHTWPEYQYAAIDVFTCGEDVDPKLAVDVLRAELKAKHVEVSEFKRGKLGRPGEVLRHKPESESILIGSEH